MSFVESAVNNELFDETVLVECISVGMLIKDCLRESSQELISWEWYIDLNTKNQLRVYELIITCYPYFYDEDCNSKTEREIDNFMKSLDITNDMMLYENSLSNIKSIISAVRQRKDVISIKNFVERGREIIYWITHHLELHMNLCFGVIALIDGHRLSVEMEEIIDKFLEVHPEYYEIIIKGQFGTRVRRDGNYEFHSIKKTERYLKCKYIETNEDVYNILHILFSIFVERHLSV